MRNINKLFHWFFFNVVFAVLPLMIRAVITSFMSGAELNSTDYINEFLFFCIVISSTMGEKKLTDLCDQYYDEILRFVRHKIGVANHHDAFDVTNKIFLILTERKGTIVDLNDLATKQFVYSTAINCCRQYFQENSRKRSHETELNDNLEIAVETMTEENIENIREYINEIFPQLTENEQVLFREYWLKGRKLYGVAEELHISYDSVRQSNSRLRTKLSALMQKKLNK